MDMQRATLAQLTVIRYNDPMATLADKAAAENEIILRQKRFRGKPTKRSKELFR